MRKRISATWVVLAVMVVATGCAGLLDSIDVVRPQDTSTPTDGLREALRIGTDRAVDSLSRTDGYLGRPELRIGVPDKLEPLEKALRVLGREDIVDEFVTSMNRAAEAAVPVARVVFVDSIREMTFEDAMTIIRGDAHEATDYFREHAGPRLKEEFQPVVISRLETVGATRKYQAVTEEVKHVPWVKTPRFDLGEYVTDRALDGLFLTLEREEEKIRRDPVARTTELLKKWFGHP